MITERDERRFWPKVALPNASGCMLWLRYIDPRTGYPRFWLAGSMRYAHRVSYVLAYGPIPDGLEIDHVKAEGCINRHCVAPLHLEAVTCQENTLRGSGLTAANARKTRCPQGHAYDTANTRVYEGRRYCRACWK